MLHTHSRTHTAPQAQPITHLHKYDWMKESHVCCPSCRSGYVLPVHRPWYRKLLTNQKKLWCQDCGTIFWREC